MSTAAAHPAGHRLADAATGAARSNLPPGVLRFLKRLGVGPRFARQCRRARAGYRAHGQAYAQPVLFIAGLPKSGTSWLERMVSSYPGYELALIPEVAGHEMRTGGSHDFDLPTGMFDRFRQMLVITKMHVWGSEHNVQVLRDANVPYVVLYRDLRDVAVSYCHYVRRTPWHPEHPVYHPLTAEEGLALFAVRTLPAYVDWVRDWHARRDPERSLEIRYEQMVADPSATLRAVTERFELPSDPQTLQSIVDANDFKRLSGGRTQGQADGTSFFRSGKAGDWVNHLTPLLRSLYGAVLADFLVEFGYEPDDAWVHGA